jgi:hypothetical protein
VIRGCARLAAAALALLALGGPVAAEDPDPVVFGGAVFDVTGAGPLDLGDLDPVLEPLLGSAGESFAGFPVTLEVDAAGAVIGCQTEATGALAPAGAALCDHARQFGHFRRLSLYELDYTRATYRFTLRRCQKPPCHDGKTFYAWPIYPFEGTAIRFGDAALPYPFERLIMADLDYTPLEYPLGAAHFGISARVTVVLTFGDSGRVTRCRPVTSSNTARIAYETCFEAWKSFRRKWPGDERHYVLSTNLTIPD